MIATIEANAEPVIVLKVPYGSVHVTAVDARDHLEMRVSQMVLCLNHLPIPDLPAPFVGLLRKMATDLANAVDTRDDAATLAGQLVELLYSGGGPSDALWICQLLADEVNETLAGMVLAGAPA